MVIDIEAACRGRCLKSAMRKESEVVASKSDRIDVEARTSLFTPFHPLPPHSTPFSTPRPTSASSNQNRLVHDTR